MPIDVKSHNIEPITALPILITMIFVPKIGAVGKSSSSSGLIVPTGTGSARTVRIITIKKNVEGLKKMWKNVIGEKTDIPILNGNIRYI